MKHTKYNYLKEQINEVAKACPLNDDKPLRRMALNDELDAIDRDLSRDVLRDKITEKTKALWMKWLTNFVIFKHDHK